MKKSSTSALLKNSKKKLKKSYITRSGEVKELDLAWFQHAKPVVPKGMKRAAAAAAKRAFLG